ncbi:MAG: SNF2-related protein [Desulfobacterales bacterium]|nr:SNF2-related protein [Desulfobacterales bacterium]
MSRKNPAQHLAMGQRWISQAEPELGLGFLISHDKRTIRIEFPGGNCNRQYSLSSAPVQRIIFKPGDRITTKDNQSFLVEQTHENNGLITYSGEGKEAHEKNLGPFMDVSMPQERLSAGLAGPSMLFDLRKEILFKISQYHNSAARGFLGGQVDLIPHQFYIAQEVCKRYFPRVLLSDETGLGKTIEAGLILHRLLVLGQIQRVLIIVPDALVHQWFIELFRKFNLNFRLFNTTYVQDAFQSDSKTNPFSGDQQGICSQSFILEKSAHRDLLIEAGWDMVIMDEAHHITDDPEFYTFMEELGRKCRGLLLLSATPEQMGPDTHFAQLRLLDPDRYYDQAVYEKEAKGYVKTAQKAKQLLDANKPVDQLLDTFGPGRVIFRNRREAIKGFPKRKVQLAPLKGNQFFATGTVSPQDPRIIYLAQLAKSIKPEKMLVICSTPAMAEQAHNAVQTHIAVDAARFDETMSLLQRDRQAAWFAKKDGARLLISSEIGSEGRNFQFAHHLFLFDLPTNPELLEQRIGRVDRIGQKKDISIHTPYICGTGQEILARWYTKGLPLLANNINGSHSIFTRFENDLIPLIKKTEQTGQVDEEQFSSLLDTSASYTQDVQARLDKGKHILLALNSFKPIPAKNVIHAIKSIDKETGLYGLMERLLDYYGVEIDLISDKPGEKTVSLSVDRIADEQFPALPQGSRTATFDRTTAISREEITFFTWDHPFISKVLDFFITREEGTSAVAKLTGWQHPAIFIETLFTLEVPSIESIAGAGRFSRLQPIHLLVDHEGKEAKNLPEDFWSQLQSDHPNWFMDMEPIKNDLLPGLVEKSRDLADKKAKDLRSKLLEDLDNTLGKEIERLEYLKQINPDISDKEVQAARSEYKAISDHLSQARIRLDAIRLIRTDV